MGTILTSDVPIIGGMRVDVLTQAGNRITHVLAFVAAWGLRQSWLIWVFGGAAIIVLAAVPFTNDLVVLNRATVDFTYPLDTALRWSFGHWPHLDYQTPVGVAYWLLQGIAGAFLDLSPKSVFLSNLMAAAAIGLASFVLIRHRLSAAHAAVLVTGLMALVLSPRMFGDPAGLISYLAPYNKTGLAILGLLFVAQFVPQRDAAHSRWLGAESCTAGLLIVWLVFLKLNFAALAVAGGIAALYFAPANQRSILGSLIVAAVATVAVAVTTNIGAAYLSDVRAVASVGNVFRPIKLMTDLARGAGAILLFSIASFAYFATSRTAAKQRLETLCVALGLLVACVAAMNQAHGYELPLVFVALLVLSEKALRESTIPNRPTIAHIAPFLAAFLLVILSVVKDVGTVRAYVFGEKAKTAIPFCNAPDIPACSVSYAYFDKHALSVLRPFPDPVLRLTPTDPAVVATHIENALSIQDHMDLCNGAPLCAMWSAYGELYDLLNLVMVTGDRPYLLGFMNPLPYYYGIEPPKHVPAWIDMGRTLSEAVHPDADTLFSDVTLLIVPRTDLSQDFGAGLYPIYADEIGARFHLVAETESWSIWRKKPIEH